MANDVDKYDIQVLTAGYFELVQHCTFKSYVVVKLGVSRVYRVVYACEHIFNGVGKLRKFSSELELACPFAKPFQLERFAIYGSLQFQSIAEERSGSFL